MASLNHPFNRKWWDGWRVLVRGCDFSVIAVVCYLKAFVLINESSLARGASITLSANVGVAQNPDKSDLICMVMLSFNNEHTHAFQFWFQLFSSITHTSHDFSFKDLRNETLSWKCEVARSPSIHYHDDSKIINIHILSIHHFPTS